MVPPDGAPATIGLPWTGSFCGIAAAGTDGPAGCSDGLGAGGAIGVGFVIGVGVVATGRGGVIGVGVVVALLEGVVVVGAAALEERTREATFVTELASSTTGRRSVGGRVVVGAGRRFSAISPHLASTGPAELAQ